MGSRRLVCFRDTALLVVGLPMGSLAALTTLDHGTTSKACPKLGSTSRAFERKAIITDLCIKSWAFLHYFPLRHVSSRSQSRLTITRQIFSEPPEGGLDLVTNRQGAI